MPTTYSECPLDVPVKAQVLMKKFHLDLIEAGVTIKFLFARNPDQPAVMHGGYPAFATVKINSLKDRVAGLDDATILIDESCWNDATEEERESVLDHELQHLACKRNKVGALTYDDADRPRLVIRKHDWHGGGFNVIAKRHGEAAIEVQAILEVQRAWKQLELEFAA